LVRIEYPPSTPPLDLDPLFFLLNPGDTIVRIYKNKRTATEFNNYGPQGRFDHHIERKLGDPKTDTQRSVYYAAPILSSPADALSCAIAEVFGEAGIMDELGLRNICFVEIIQELKLLDLRGDGAMMAGCTSAATIKIPDKQCTQEWSRHFYENISAYSQIDGVIYAGAYNEQPSIMLYERAINAVRCTLDLPLKDLSISTDIQQIARRLRIFIPPEEWL
jgi:hypothetical protein